MRLSKKANWVASLGLLAIIAVMPFHAFLSVWSGNMFGHEAIWQAWKEALLLVIALFTAFLAARDQELRRKLYRPLPLVIYAYVLCGLVVTALTHPEIKAIAFGIKTDYEFLLIVVLAYVLSSKRLERYGRYIIVGGASLVAVFGVLQAYFLPKDVLAYFGYGPATIMPFENLTAQVSAFRILSTLGGPNQLGSYLVLPMCLTVAFAFHKFRWWQPAALALFSVCLLHTYSRSAWIAAIAGVVFTLAFCVPPRLRLRMFLVSSAILVIAVIATIVAVRHQTSLQSYVLHGSLSQYAKLGSDAERLNSQRHGLDIVARSPFGHGLGSAGPASKYGHNYTITENYYLQLAVEVGIAGLLLFAAIELILAYGLWQRRLLIGAPALLGTLMGISIINFLLHGWADSSTALIFWCYAGLLMGLPNDRLQRG